MKDKKHHTKEEILEYPTKYMYCTVGDLKKHIEKHNIPDDAPVVVQRVEDVYYDKHGWKTYLKKGEHYWNTVHFNENMAEEILRRERGEEPHYSMEDPSKFINSDPDFLEQMMEQYSPVWCAVYYKDDENILFLDLHY